ncbi:MAG: IS21 family transposase [Myxococcales bacterium]|nr:IS21 family transposase [Myxococcales bacterium]
MRIDHYILGKSIRVIAREQGVHRRVVRQALADAVPPERKVPERESPVLTAALRQVIDEWLTADLEAPRKQRHTARRVFARLVAEQDFAGAESTVRRYVCGRRREIGLARNVFVPQAHPPGMEAEADFYEAYVDFPSGRTKVFVLVVRSSYSGREFQVAFLRLIQQAFLEGLSLALAWFGGVFPTLRLDNLNAAVKQVLQGRRRVETGRMVAFRSHYLFDTVYCLPGKEGAHEKGGVEGEVGRSRRTHLVPVPRMPDLDALNAHLRRGCEQDDGRRREGRPRTVGEEFADEVPLLRPLPAKPFDTAKGDVHDVDSKSRVKVRTNRYSVPVRLAERKVEVRVLARYVEVVHEGKVVARHERLYGKHDDRLELDHYLELLKQKPGAMAGSVPLRQARDRACWPACYDALWSRMRRKHGESAGTREMVDVLFLLRSHEVGDVQTAVEMALQLGCSDAGAIAVLVRQLAMPDIERAPLEGLGELDDIGTPASGDLGSYDALLRARGAA